MAERKKTVRDRSGKSLVGTVVEVTQSTERFSEINLEDGTILRMKPVVTEVVRIDGQWDKDGNPAYSVRSTNILIVVESPTELRKKSR